MLGSRYYSATVRGMAMLGVFLSGARDLYAALELPGGSWPWSSLPYSAPEA